MPRSLAPEGHGCWRGWRWGYRALRRPGCDSAIYPAAVVIAVAAIVLLVLLPLGAAQYFGLTERVFLGSILVWLVVVEARLQCVRLLFGIDTGFK